MWSCVVNQIARSASPHIAYGCTISFVRSNYLNSGNTCNAQPTAYPSLLPKRTHAQKTEPLVPKPNLDPHPPPTHRRQDAVYVGQDRERVRPGSLGIRQRRCRSTELLHATRTRVEIHADRTAAAYSLPPEAGGDEARRRIYPPTGLLPHALLHATAAPHGLRPLRCLLFGRQISNACTLPSLPQVRRPARHTRRSGPRPHTKGTLLVRFLPLI